MITKKKKSLFLSFPFLFILFYSSAVSYILADSSSSGRELFFGPIVSGLEGTNIPTSKSLDRNVLLGGGKTKTLYFALETNKTSLNTVAGRDYVKIEGLKPYGNPGDPQLPFKSFVITLPINSEVSGVSVSDVSYRPILNKLDIVQTPFPVAHTQKDKEQTTQKTTNENKTFIKSRTSSSDSQSFFPGNLVSYYTGTNSRNRYVFIKFFPIQYIPDSKRAMLITNAEITLNYTESSGADR